jgi:small conductance mechanosensitive channel
LLRAVLSKKGVFPSVLDNIPRPNYKNVISHFQQKRIKTVINAIKDVLSFIIWIVAMVTILPEFGVNAAPIIASLGLAGLALGLAARDMIVDLLAGFFIIVEGELNIGDKVKIADVSGNVVAVSLRRTILQGRDGIYIIPNREIKTIKRYNSK